MAHGHLEKRKFGPSVPVAG